MSDHAENSQVRVSTGLLYVTCCGDRYYKYGIHINTNDPAFSLTHTHIWRRYSEFCWLRKILKQHHYMNLETQVADLPSQGLFRNREDPKFMEERRAGLEKFIRSILSEPLFKADRALHLFLQTTLSTNDIEFNLNGQRHDQIVVIKKSVPHISESRLAPSIARSILQDKSSLDDQISSTSNSPKGSFRSVLKMANSNSSTNSPLTIKRVTFSHQVRIITLTNAWPVNIQVR